MKEVQAGDVVQISPDAACNEGLLACFAVVDEVKGWGVTAAVRCPGKGVAYVRLHFGNFERIGAAVWVEQPDG